MAEISDLVPIDDNNTARWPEGMPPSDVNNAGRADEGILARWHRDTNASLTSAGTASAYTLTTNQTLTAYYDGLEVAFIAHVANNASATLALGGLTAAEIQTADGIALAAGDIPINSVVNVISQDNATTPTWRLMNTPAGSEVAQKVITTRGDIIRGDSSGNRERLALGAADTVLTSDGTDIDYQVIPLPTGYLDGFELSAAADTDHDMTMSTGACRNEADSINVRLTSALTKQIDASFVKGDNNGGLFTGTVAADTSYHACLITEDSSGDVDWGWDTDPGGANTPSGFTFRRTVGSRYTDSSANLVLTRQSGDLVRLDQGVNDLNTSGNTTGVSVILSIPTGRVLFPIITAACVSDVVGESPGYGLITALDSANIAPTALIFNFSGGGTTGNDIAAGPAQIDYIPSDTSAQVRWRTDKGSIDHVRISTYGWYDRRGKR